MMQQPYWALDSYFKKHNDILIQGEQARKGRLLYADQCTKRHLA